MKVIRYRPMVQDATGAWIVAPPDRFERADDGGEVAVYVWHIAFSRADLDRKLDGRTAQVIMPAEPWWRQWLMALRHALRSPIDFGRRRRSQATPPEIDWWVAERRAAAPMSMVEP